MPRDEAWLLKEKYQGEKNVAFFADCKRLALGEPLGYLIGFVPFLHCKIWLDSKPLVPRPETEFWTEVAIKEINQSAPLYPQVLDLCAGSGCIGVAVKKALPQTIVDFSEIDARHLPTIQKNLTQNSINFFTCAIFHSNLFESCTKTYDFILSNPPYIDTALKRTDQSVTENEPYVALFGGEGGMEVITDIIKKAPTFLNASGQLWLEHEPEQSLAIKELGACFNFVTTTHKDQYGIERYSVLVLQ